ncbi:hypothetical protein K440DRAFT_664979 [Wilcoxina mikolae CBS 423.85]|nr:hypothetical protein K440DRAFT_664979 [Wilcoxina mikolae CBS 423.85]
MEKNAMAVVSTAKSTQPLVKSVQPAEDQKIEAAFGNLELFIASHTEKFYNLSLPLSGEICEFEPAGATTTKAALRRYIARNVFQLIRDDKSTGIRSENDCRDRLVRELKPYTLTDSEQDKWKKHLDDILKQGTVLGEMLSSQRGTKWQIGTLFPATTKPLNIIDVLVFPSLQKDGNEVRAEKKFRGTKKPKPTSRTIKLRGYFKRKNSMSPDNPTIQRVHKDPDESDHHIDHVRTVSRSARVTVLIRLLELIIYLLQCLRVLLQEWDTVEPIPEAVDESQDREDESTRSEVQPLGQKLHKFPRAKWADWDSIIDQIRKEGEGVIQRSNTA